MTNEELLEFDVDVLMPALENQITATSAERIRAGTVVEVANGPTAAEADSILRGRSLSVVPDILANAGGVTVSHVEWTQNRSGLVGKVEEVHERLRSVMTAAFEATSALAEEEGIDLRTSAHALARRRISAVEAQGTHAHFRGEG
ncbi:MAG: hypothetical protein ACRD1K_16235 [Acidimicrobiales bacterium]